MVNPEYHKGLFCVYTSVFCQEGYCHECEIYKKKPMATKQINRRYNTKTQNARQPVLVY